MRFTCSGSDENHSVDSSLGLINFFLQLVFFLKVSFIGITGNSSVSSSDCSTASGFFCFLFCFLCCKTSLFLKACSFSSLNCFSSSEISAVKVNFFTGLFSEKVFTSEEKFEELLSDSS